MHKDSIVKQFMYKVASLVPDKMFLSLKYKKNFGRFPDWKHPKTFCEKINWLKLFDRNPIYTRMVDKYEAKRYVAGIIGEQYIIPTLGVWERAEDIDFDSLPDQFVLKATHDSGRVVVCTDKSKLDKNNAVKTMKKSLKRDFYAVTREWPYKNVKRRIIAEKFIAPRKTYNYQDLTVYKFFCFNGDPKCCQVICGCSTVDIMNFYNMEWQHLDYFGFNSDVYNKITLITCPIDLENMIAICKELSDGFPFVQVALYRVDEQEYLCELTSYPASEIDGIMYGNWPEKVGFILGLPTTIVTRKICSVVNGIVEMRDESSIYDDLKDYKFFCFNGKVKCFKIDYGRFTEHRANYYSPEGILLPFGEKKCPPNYEHHETMPHNLAEMMCIAEKLSSGHAFLRVDLYNVSGKIYFGELTFFPDSGMGAFTDAEWDFKFGEWINLNNIHS